ncbi:MAG: translation initiation factor [Porphyromonadaceae bacterium]|nr:translation initiation factor [Porphyromonadaceae bacterium]
MANDWKSRLGVLYSTNPDYQYEYEELEQAETLALEAQKLRIGLSRKQRAGKEVSLITGFVGRDEDLTDLCKQLKQRCGVGGSAKDGEIIIQGDQREKLLQILLALGYKQTKKAGG